MRFAEIIIPLALGQTFTYTIPESLRDMVAAGMRVEVPFGRRRLYSGIVMEVHNRETADVKPRYILDVIDDAPILLDKHFKFWQWIAAYYHCYIGEVMLAALPSGLKIQSETIITKGHIELMPTTLGDKEYLIMEALEHQDKLKIQDIQGILQQKTVFPIIRRMLDKQLVSVHEEMKDGYTEKEVKVLRLAPELDEDPEALKAAFDSIEKYEKQESALLAFLFHRKKEAMIRKSFLANKSDVSPSSINTLIRKGILLEEEVVVSRIKKGHEEIEVLPPLSDDQVKAIDSIRQFWEDDQVVLLHGVTGSGKTRIYIDFIREMLDEGKQVLYLLPEIALTTHFIDRLTSVFGDQVIAYHSRLNNHERVEIWKKSLTDPVIILGARSSVFLPFGNLGLVIVDESHDPSFKQQEPSPRYHGRDAAIFLAGLFKARVILGTATPSVESEYNARVGKYGKVRLTERFGGIPLPEIQLVNISFETGQKLLYNTFSQQLITEMQSQLQAGRQIILFRNRRGYTPHIACKNCGWHSMCIHCDIGMTYHKYRDQLYCHLCGYHTNMPKYCPSCGNPNLSMKGAGTEKIEEHLKMIFEDVEVARMDQDTTRSKRQLKQVIQRFDEGAINILVGTQMITKGLDFDNVGLVGILNADALLFYPDFRATERAFQLMTQVAGRAGRKEANAKVIIQAYSTNHPVFPEVIQQDFQTFYARELGERKQFMFPPYVRLIHLTLKHKDKEILEGASRFFYSLLHKKLGNRFKGPIVPPIERIKNQYLKDFVIKLDKVSNRRNFILQVLREAEIALENHDKFKRVRLVIDVDPV